jgi:hypothetical protein
MGGRAGTNEGETHLNRAYVGNHYGVGGVRHDFSTPFGPSTRPHFQIRSRARQNVEADVDLGATSKAMIIEEDVDV